MVGQLEHMKKRTFAFLLFASLMISASFAQVSDRASANTNAIADVLVEEIDLFSDRQLYIAGETLWFSLSLKDRESNSLSSYSKVAYVDLVGSSGIVMSRVKIEVNEGKGSGSLDLSKDLTSGYYELRSYTQAMRNFGADLFEKYKIIILNADQSLLTVSDAFNKAKEIKPLSSSDAIVTLSLDKNVYRQRDRVDIEIDLKDSDGRPLSSEVAISVALGGVNLDQGKESKTVQIKSNPKTKFLPELIGMHLCGRIQARSSDQTMEGIKVFLAFPGKRAMVYSALSDKEGMFRFILPKLYGPKEIILQLEPNYEDQFTIELEDEYHNSPSKEDEVFKLPEEWLGVANASLENASIGSAYTAFKEQVYYVEDSTFYNIPFYGIYDKQYKLDDYTRFPLPEFFFEIVPEVRVQGKYGEEKLKVANTWSLPNRESPPLLLVDGVPVFDQRKFLKINNKLISKTKIVTEPFWLNTMIFDGIIEINSFENDARSFELPESALRSGYLTLLPKRSFSTPDYKTDQSTNLPDFRNTLYWNPSVTTNSEGKATVSFYTSDVVQDYSIIVDGKESKVSPKAEYMLSVIKKEN